MKGKALVAGGAGFLGSNLCRVLVQGNYEVVCLDSLLTGKTDNIGDLKKRENFEFINHDITKPLPQLSADFVFHLASPASPNHHSKLSYHALPLETMLVNTVGTLELLKFSEKCKAKFLFTSTSEVYGDPLEHPQKEEYRGNVSTTGPRSVYDESKRFGETLVSYFWRQKGLDARIGRVFNTYGPGMAKEDRRMIITFIDQALSGKPITVFGDGKQTRSLCFVDDMVDGLLSLMFSDDTKGEVVNLGSEEEHTVLEYAQLVKKLTNSESEIIFSEKLPEDDPIKRRPDISKAKKIMRWEPKVSLEEGIQKTIEYFKNL